MGREEDDVRSLTRVDEDVPFAFGSSLFWSLLLRWSPVPTTPPRTDTEATFLRLDDFTVDEPCEYVLRCDACALGCPLMVLRREWPTNQTDRTEESRRLPTANGCTHEARGARRTREADEQ